jgi:anti-sigma factor RsiW
MTCQETVELMQRYLDHDLSETEERELRLHLQHCGECAGLFERLQRLDDELAQLPKVTPAYSLVDAILPQLAELDRLPAAFEETAAKEPAAAVPVGGIPRTRRAFASWKLAGGVAVAAAMIGIFVMKEQNLLTPSLAMKGASTSAAENSKALDARAGGSANAAGAGGAGAERNAGPGRAASAASADKNAAGQPDGQTKAQEQARIVASEPEQAEPAQTNGQPQGAARQPGTEDNRVAISASPADAPSGPEEGGAATASSPSSGTGSAAANPSQPAPAPDGNASAAPASAAGTTGPAPAAAPRFKGIAAGSVPDGSFNALAAPAPTPAAATLKSPDGKLIAAVEGLKVVVRQTDTGATVAASTYSWSAADVIALIGFSEDGKLTYRVQHPNGADEATLDVATKSETITPVPAEDKK